MSKLVICASKMSGLTTFDGKGDVHHWAINIKAKLISKGYKSQLLDANRPPNNPAGPRAAWDKEADKALGIILTYLHPDLSAQFETSVTPETLIRAVTNHFARDVAQEVNRLEEQLTNLSYDGSDPLEWTSKVRNLITKLTNRNSAPAERTVRVLVLKALEKEPEYKIRIEMIRYSNPNIVLVDLWTEVAKLPWPIERDSTSAFAAMKLTNDNRKM